MLTLINSRHSHTTTLAAVATSFPVTIGPQPKFSILDHESFTTSSLLVASCPELSYSQTHILITFVRKARAVLAKSVRTPVLLIKMLPIALKKFSTLGLQPHHNLAVGSQLELHQVDTRLSTIPSVEIMQGRLEEALRLCSTSRRSLWQRITCSPSSHLFQGRNILHHAMKRMWKVL